MLTIDDFRRKFWSYFLASIIGSVSYGWFFDKTLEYMLACPYWTAFTLLAVRFVLGSVVANETNRRT